MILLIIILILNLWKNYNKKFQEVTITNKIMIKKILEYQNETNTFLIKSTNINCGHLNILFASFLVNTYHKKNEYNIKYFHKINCPLYFHDTKYNMYGYIIFHQPRSYVGKMRYIIQYWGNVWKYAERHHMDFTIPITFKIDVSKSHLTFNKYYKAISKNNKITKTLKSYDGVSFFQFNYNLLPMPKSLKYATGNFPSLLYFIGGDNQYAFINSLANLKRKNIVYYNKFSYLISHCAYYVIVMDLKYLTMNLDKCHYLNIILYCEKSCLVIKGCEIDTFDKYPCLKKYSCHPVIYL